MPFIAQRIVGPEFESLAGVPWRMKPSGPIRPVVAQREALRLPIQVQSPEPTMPVRRRATYILASDVEKYGPSEGCKACLEIAASGSTRYTHMSECRARTEVCMANDEAGRARLVAKKRKVEEAPLQKEESPKAEAGEQLDYHMVSGGLE